MCGETNCTHAVADAVGEHHDEAVATMENEGDVQIVDEDGGVPCTCDREETDEQGTLLLNEYEHWEGCPFVEAYPIPHVRDLKVDYGLEPEQRREVNTQSFRSFVSGKMR